MRNATRTTSARWPFWLLIAAWVCANSPQAATYSVLAWMVEARQFSHQQQLTVEVAHLLTGQKQTSTQSTMVAAADEEGTSEPLAQVPAAAVLKKIDLSAEKNGDALRPSEAHCAHVMTEAEWRGALRAPPLHGPPRGEATT